VGRYRVICGNAYDEIPEFEDNSIDLTFTSPDPEESIDDLVYLFYQQLFFKTKDTGSLLVQIGDYHTDAGYLMIRPHIFAYKMSLTPWVLRSDLIWHRPDDSVQDDTTRFKRDCEHLFFFTKRARGYTWNKDLIPYHTSLATFPYNTPADNTIDSGFPEGLIELALRACTHENDMVLDPFAGSGVTGVVALRMGRKFTGIEIDPQKITLINKRLRSVARQ
jgi:DNA modification methylase